MAAKYRLFGQWNPRSHFVCTLVLQVTYREAYTSEGAESQLGEEKIGQTQGDVSTHESSSLVKKI